MLVARFVCALQEVEGIVCATAAGAIRNNERQCSGLWLTRRSRLRASEQWRRSPPKAKPLVHRRSGLLGMGTSMRMIVPRGTPMSERPESRGPTNAVSAAFVHDSHSCGVDTPIGLPIMDASADGHGSR